MGDALRCHRLHALAGVLPPSLPREHALDTYLGNLAWAARQAADASCTLLVEALNPHDVPGYLLATQADAHRVVQDVGAPNLKVQLDLYHCAMCGGDPAAELRAQLPTGRIGHLQIAGLPGRHEPDDGRLDPHALFGLIDSFPEATELWVGAEYLPRRGAEPGGTSAGLGWMRARASWARRSRRRRSVASRRPTRQPTAR